jgi:hypothetical protein
MAPAEYRPSAKSYQGTARLAVLPLVSVALLLPAWVNPAAGQVKLEAGLGAGSGCVRGESSCADRDGFVAPHAGVRIRDAFIVRGRLVSLGLESIDHVFGDISIFRSNRSRRLLLAEGMYAFRRSRAVRPLLGAAVGWLRDRETVRCAPVDCNAIPPGGPSAPPSGDRFHASLGLLTGIAYHPPGRFSVEGLVGFHDFPGEQGATITVAVAGTISLWEIR